MRSLAFSIRPVLSACGVALLAYSLAAPAGAADIATRAPFDTMELSIDDIQQAILSKQLTSEQVLQLYLARIKAYNGTCVKQPDGILGKIEPIANAGQINALMTLNLKPKHRKALGFDERKARSMTDPNDDASPLPDAIEVARALDRKFAETGKLAGPLHGVVLAVKDQYDTADMRSALGMDIDFANDRPPDDATFIQRLREAGAIIVAKANLGEGGSQRSRSSFGGTLCNPYDTTRSPGSSSGGSGSSVGANLVTCAIAEETGGSALHPARNASAVGIAPTQQLVSQDGMIAKAFNHRVGAICRNVKDIAKVLQVIAGYDPKDEITAFAVGRMPENAYETFANEKRLDGIKIGVVREFMNEELFNHAARPSIEIAERAIEQLKTLGATIVDPGPTGALFQDCVGELAPVYRNTSFVAQFPQLFPQGSDQIAALIDLAIDPRRVPDKTNIRSLGRIDTAGEYKYYMNLYLKQRGDANIKTMDDMIAKSRFFTDLRPGTDFTSYRQQLINANKETTLDLAGLFQDRLAYQTIVLQCMARQGLDAVTYASGISVAPVLGEPFEPSKNNSPSANSVWGRIAANGFPSVNVPAGFTTEVFDRVADPSAPGGSRLVGPVPAKLPASVTFLARPFDEPLLFRIASAYETSTHHRVMPPGFGPVPDTMLKSVMNYE